MRTSTRITTMCITFAALAGMAGLTACKGDGEGAAGQAGGQRAQRAPSDLAGLLSGLAAGETTLELTGAVTSTGEYTTAEDPRYAGATYDTFRPATGGGRSRRGSNADGPYALSLYIDATHQDEPENVVRAWATLVLPEGASAGRVYEVASFSDAEDDQVQAHVQGDGLAWTFARDMSGRLYVDSIGDSITAAFSLEAASGAGESAPRVKAKGAANALPLTRQAESEYEISVNGETEPGFARITGRAQGDHRMMIIGHGIYLYVPADSQPGTYPIGATRDDGAIRAQFTSHEVSEVSGELVLKANEDRLDATFEISATGDDQVSVSGELRYFTLSDDG
jgi:hypothetical protein